MRRSKWLLALSANLALGAGFVATHMFAEDGGVQTADWTDAPADSDMLPAEFPDDAAPARLNAPDTSTDEAPASAGDPLPAPGRKLKSYADDLFGELDESAPDSPKVVPANAAVPEDEPSQILPASAEGESVAPAVSRRLPHPAALKKAKSTSGSLEALLSDPRNSPRSSKKQDPLANAPLPWESPEPNVAIGEAAAAPAAEAALPEAAMSASDGEHGADAAENEVDTAPMVTEELPAEELAETDSDATLQQSSSSAVAPAIFMDEELVSTSEEAPQPVAQPAAPRRHPIEDVDAVKTIGHEENEPGRLQPLPAPLRRRTSDLNAEVAPIESEAYSEGGLRPANHLSTGRKLSEIDTTSGTKLPVQTSSKRLTTPIDTNSSAVLDAIEGGSPARPPIGKSSRSTRPVSASSDSPTQGLRPRSSPSVMTLDAVAGGEAGQGESPVQTVRHVKSVPNLSVEWASRGGINVGQTCECDLIVRNAGDAAAVGVEVEARFPETVRVIDAEPAANAVGARLTWQIDSLEAGDKKAIRVRFVPTQRGQINADAQVRFTGRASGTFEVAEPMLAVKLDGPAEVMKNESAAHTVIISNPGTGLATNVRIEALVSAGLDHPTHSKKLVMELGSLNPGETRNVRLALSAIAGGDQTIDLHASADAGLEEKVSRQVHVTAPSLKTSIEGPGLRYLGRRGTYTLTVNNDGQAATDNVRVMHKIPDGFEFVSADRGAQFDAANRLLSWYVGRLEPGQSTKIELLLEAEKIGQFTHFIRATADQETVADAQLDADVVGAALLVVQMKDQDDPVEVGVDAVYEIRVKNEGSAAARNVLLVCDIPSGCEFSSATGSRDFTLEAGRVTFQALSELAPGKTATFELRLKGESAGRRRVRASVTSESEEEPLVYDESTQFYN